MQLKSTCGPRAMPSSFTIKYVKHYILSWFKCLIVFPFRAKSNTYYSKKRAKLMQSEILGLGGRCLIH